MIKIFNDFIFEHKLHTNQIGLLNYIDKISKNNLFIFVDTETTGLGGFKKQQLTQISAIAYEYNFNRNSLKKVGDFNKKIKISDDMINRLEDPKDNIKDILKFNGYDKKIIGDSEYYDELDTIKEFKNWISNLEYNLKPILIMQNAYFDMNMLVGRGREKITHEVLDTKQMIQFFVIPIVQKLAENNSEYVEILNKIGKSERDFGLINSSMSKWGPFFDIDMSGYHDALTDCKITSQMFIKIIDFIKENINLNISKYQVERIKIK